MTGQETPLGLKAVQRGYTNEYANLRICGTCFELYEEGPLATSQLCACNSRREQPRWTGYDFNERAMLCRCCALIVVPSGSRWAPYFCRECQLLSMGASIWARRLIMPIGRHTIMHGWVPRTPVPTLAAHDGDAEALAETVETGLNAVVNRTGHLWTWYRSLVPRHLAALGLRGGVFLHEYLLALERDSEGDRRAVPGRFPLFQGLCEHFLVGHESGSAHG